MRGTRSASVLLILAIGTSIVESVEQYSTLPRALVESKTAKISDYENALKPAQFKKRSIANIARLLLGGTVPPNHPLVKYPDQKAFNLASNIMAAFPGAGGLQTAESRFPELSAMLGASRQPAPGSPLQNLQQLFETKSKILPYTGQVVGGVSGLASVKGDLIRQIHSISTQAIAQAAAEAAARALASAAAAHAVTNTISNSPGAKPSATPGWAGYPSQPSSQYLDPMTGKTPGEQPGPPYPPSPYTDYSAHINHYQAPPQNYNPSAYTTTTPAPTPVQPYQNGYYTLYQQAQAQAQAQAQQSVTPPPGVGGPARPTLSPNTLIATTPTGYNPLAYLYSPPNQFAYQSPLNKRFPLSVPRAVPAGVLQRHAAQYPSTSPLLSAISSLLGVSTGHPAYQPVPPATGVPGHQQQGSALFPAVLPPAHTNSPYPAPSILRSTLQPAPSASYLSAHLSQPLPQHTPQQQPTYPQQQSAHPISQGSSHHGGYPGSYGPSYLQQYLRGPGPYAGPQAPSASVHAPSYSLHPNGPSHPGANYAQPGTNPYATPGVSQSPAQFSHGSPAHSPGGYGAPGANLHGAGPGYPGYQHGAGSSSGHAGGWNTQHAGPFASASSWPSSNGGGSSSPAHWNTPGYPSPTPGNINNSPRSPNGFQQSPTQWQAQASNYNQQAYPAPSQNAYQSPAPNNYAQAPYTPQQPYPAQSYPNGAGGFGNNYLANQPNQNRYNSQYQPQDLRQAASNMGAGDNNNDYYDDTELDQNDDDDDNLDVSDSEQHHSYQPAPTTTTTPNPPRTRPPSQNTRVSRPNKNSYGNSRPWPEKKRPYQPKPQRPLQKPQKPEQGYRHKNRRPSAPLSGENPGKRVTSPGPSYPPPAKKGSNFVEAVVLDASVDSDVASNGAFAQSSSEEQPPVYYKQHYKQTKPYYKSPANSSPAKNRWRSKDSLGQRPNPVSGYHSPSGTRWQGGKSFRPKTPQKNESPDGRGQTGRDAQYAGQPGRNYPSGKNSPGKKVNAQETQKQPKTQAAQIYRGQQQKQPEGQQKSKDVYTTLPEYVFRVGERPDVFLRPGQKRKQQTGGIGQRKFIRPRVGETEGNAGNRGLYDTEGESSGNLAQAENLANEQQQQQSIYDEQTRRKQQSEEYREKGWRPATGATTQTASQEEEFIGAGNTAYGHQQQLVADRMDNERGVPLSDMASQGSAYLASEELDPEEREAFVEDVYADDQYSHNQYSNSHSSNYYPQRRQEYEDDQQQGQATIEEDEETGDDYKKKKREASIVAALPKNTSLRKILEEIKKKAELIF